MVTVIDVGDATKVKPPFHFTHFIFYYLCTVAPSICYGCFSGAVLKENNSNKLLRKMLLILLTCCVKFNFEAFLKSGKRGHLLDIKFHVIPKLTTTKSNHNLASTLFQSLPPLGEPDLHANGNLL